MGRKTGRTKSRKGRSPKSRLSTRLRPKATARLAERFRLASLEHRAGRLAAAETGYREVLAAAPGFPGAELNYALLARSTGRLDLALRLAQGAVASQPDEPTAHATLGNLLLEHERAFEAVQAFRAALRLDPGHVNARFNLASAFRRMGEPETAASELHQLVERFPEDPELRVNLGGALLDAGRVRDAKEALGQALALSPDDPDALNELGLAHVDAGEFEDGARCYRRIIEGKPDHPHVWLNYSKTRRFVPADRAEIEEAVRAAERLDARADPGPESGDIHFALGKMFDDLGEYDLAFEHFRQGNEILRRHTPFDPRAAARLVDDMRTRFDKAWFARVRGWGDPAARPIFIVGMPRSGTTLIEQILATHPLVHGGGELIRLPNIARKLLAGGDGLPASAALPERAEMEAAARDYLDYTEARAGTAVRVTDKLPENYHHLGLISSLFPNASIVHVRRHPMDVCVSNYLVRFHRGHAYSYDFSSLACEYGSYERLMRHWRTILPSPLYELSYESLVESLESETRKLLDFCGLGWDEGCLDFHRTTRPVHTASSWQVRQPVYRHSIQRWRNYERHLEPLREALRRSGVCWE